MTRAVLAATLSLLLSAPAAHAALPEFPNELPGDVTASSVRSDPDTWLVGATPGAASAKIADRYGARHSGLGNYVVERSRAKALAGELEKAGLLLYAQANTILKTKQTVPDDPLSSPPNAWRAKVAPRTFMPPAVAPASPLIALVDAAADATHPEWAGGNFSTIPGVPVDQLARHGHRGRGRGAAERRRHPRRVAQRAGAQRPAARGPRHRGRDHLRLLG